MSATAYVLVITKLSDNLNITVETEFYMKFFIWHRKYNTCTLHAKNYKITKRKMIFAYQTMIVLSSKRIHNFLIDI